MSITSECSSLESSISGYDSADFDLGILDDVDLLGEVIELSCVQLETQSEDYRRVRKINKRPKRVVKHSSSSLPYKSKSTHANMAEVETVAATVVSGETTEIVALSESDLYFNSRFIPFLTRRPHGALPDSIFYFPAAMVGCLNSGDNLGLADLLHFSMKEECNLGIYCFNSKLSTRAFLKFFEVLNIIHPDRIMYLRDTVITNNQITSSAVMKFTDCKLLFDVVSKTVNEPDLMSMFNTRADHLKRRLFVADRPEEERQQLVQLVESDKDLVIYGTIHFHVTFDEVTNKATGLYLSGGLTSAHPALTESIED